MLVKHYNPGRNDHRDFCVNGQANLFHNIICYGSNTNIKVYKKVNNQKRAYSISKKLLKYAL